MHCSQVGLVLTLVVSIRSDQISPKLLARLSTSLMEMGTDASGSLGFARWLLKPPWPLEMQMQEPKMKVVHSSNMVVELIIAIEFMRGLSVNCPF